jgi:hypothetical protein
VYWTVFQLEFAAVAVLTCLVGCDPCLQVDVYCLVAPFLPLLILHFECGPVQDPQIIFRTEVEYSCAWWSSPSSHHGRSNVCCFDILRFFISVKHWFSLPVTAVLLTCLLSALIRSEVLSGKQIVCETLDANSTLTWLIAQENFIVYCAMKASDHIYIYINVNSALLNLT